MADFLVDHPCVAINSHDINYVEIKAWKLYFDGSRHQNGAGIGLLLVSPCGEPTYFMFEILYECSNNEAEYEALIMGLELLVARGARNVDIIGDSQLVIKQLTREYRCESQTLAKYFVVAVRLLREFDSVSLRHVSRRMNEVANELVQIASNYKIPPCILDSLVRVEKIFIPIEEREVNSFDIIAPDDWRKPIVDYLRNPNNPVERKTRYRVNSYDIMGDTLFKKSVDGNLLACLGESKAYIALGEVHEGICGAHQAGEKMKWVLRR